MDSWLPEMPGICASPFTQRSKGSGPSLGYSSPPHSPSNCTLGPRVPKALAS